MFTPDPTTLRFIDQHRHDDVRELMLAAARWPEVDVRFACQQIEAWQRAQTKLPLWAAEPGAVYPVALSMEQCSSQTTAAYKAEIVADVLSDASDDAVQKLDICDLTGGFGVDATMIMRGLQARFPQSDIRLTMVERDADLCQIARHNLPIMGVAKADVVNAAAEEAIARIDGQKLIFIDPARRDVHGRRTYAISDCTPDVCQMQTELLKRADWLMLKLSPMLDVSDTLRRLDHVVRLYVVSVDGECKECLTLQSASSAEALRIVCVNLSERHERQMFSFTPDEQRNADCPFATQLGNYLYEPNASILKAGALRCIAQRYGLKKLHPNSHLYTSDRLVGDFPGRRFAVVECIDFSSRNIKSAFRSIGKANVTTRNFPLTVDELRRRLKLAEGGSEYLFATTLADERRVVVRCQKTV